MSLRTEAETPAAYIAYGLQHIERLTTQTFGEMVEHHFDTMGENAGKIFLQFFEAAQGNEDLGAEFHTAVKRTFLGLKDDKPRASRRWRDVMAAIVTAAETDAMLATYVRRDLVGHAIPAMLGTAKSTPAHYQAAADILSVTGQSAALADCVYPAMAHRLAKWALGPAGNDFTRAADKFTTWRAAPVFAEAIDEIEDKAGIHVHGLEVPAEHGKGVETLVLRFDRAREHVEVSVMHVRGGHAGFDDIDLDGDYIGHYDQIAEALLAESKAATLPWVEPIATNAYNALTVT